MKKLLVTKRVDITASYQERRDAIDQNWSAFMMSCGFLPIYASNSLEHVQLLLQEFDFAGMVLTGGNDLEKYGGLAPERDHIERYLIEHAITAHLPLIGICRGMQLIQDYFGVPLKQIENHVNTDIALQTHAQSQYVDILSKIEKVKAYHHWGTTLSIPELFVTAQSEKGIVMAIEHTQHPIFGQMWHPERNHPFSKHDMALFNRIMKD